MTRVYLAGPDVFLPDAIEIGRRKVAICKAHGVSDLYPLDNKVDLAAPDASLQIDSDGLTVEDFRLNDNLMMIHALDLYGCPLVTPQHMPHDTWHDVTAFEMCVRLAAKQFRARE